MPTASTARAERNTDIDLVKAAFYLFLFSSLFLLIDPFYFGFGVFRVTRDIGPVKYVGLMFGLVAIFFSLVGMAINMPRSRQPPWRDTLVRAWPILLFGLLVTAGSLVARFYLGITETFLQLGVGTLGLPLAVVLFWGIQDHLLVVRRFLWGLLLVMPVVIVWVVYNRIRDGQAFHTEIFLFVPLCVYFFLALRRRWFAWVVLIAVIALGIASHKNTAYLILLVALTQLLLISAAPYLVRATSLRRMIVVYGLFVVLLVGIAVVSFLLLNREELLPSGNLDVRSITYKAAMYRFFSSPIYGTGFTATTLVPLTGLNVLGSTSLETHSDMLDVLSHGGLLGAMLFLFGIYRVYFRAVAILRSPVSDHVKFLVHGLSAIVVCGLITACFNSPLLSLPNGLLFWFAFGLLAAVADYGRLLLTTQHVDLSREDACPK